MRFSGHDTFHCKEQWLLKGLQLYEHQSSMSAFVDEDAISKLGVGKNMVRAVQHWLKAFGLISDNMALGALTNLIFVSKKLDPYLENDGTLWLLQYYLCHTQYASIYKIVFADYFLDKANLEFTETQIIQFIKRQLLQSRRDITENTLASDFKVLIKTFAPPKKNIKTVEDDFNAPLLSLNLISNTGRINDYKESVYRINRGIHENITEEIFIYCLLTEFEETTITHKQIRDTVASYLCLSNEGLDLILEKVCVKYPEFVYLQDAGNRELQVKITDPKFKFQILEKHYEIYA